MIRSSLCWSSLLGLSALALLGCASDTHQASTAAIPAAGAPLIARSVLFGNPDRAQGRLSPDGRSLAWLQPVNGVLNVWVAPINDLAAGKPVTSDTGRGIRSFFWAYTSEDLLYIQDKGGDENWKIYRVHLASGDIKDLTPFDQIPGPDGKPITLPDGKPLRPTARIESVSIKFPTEIMVGLNTRSPQFHDLYRVNIRTGDMTKVLENDAFVGFEIDDDYRVRFASRLNASGGVDVFVNSGRSSEASSPASSLFEPFDTIPMADTMTTSILGFDQSGRHYYAIDSRGRDTGALLRVDAVSKQSTVLAENPRADAGGVMIHPVTKSVQAVSFNYTRPEWTILDRAITRDFEALRRLAPGSFTVTSRSLDDSRWTVTYILDNGPARTYLWDRNRQSATFLFTNRKDLEGLALARMYPVVIRSRDGLDLVSYLTLPAESYASPQDAASTSDAIPAIARRVPMVLNVHGGPWARDSWGFDPEHQWLANRGYAVLSVNFRGSTGFGKRFINAANREWGGKMHDDLIDAVNWAVERGIADPDRVAIYGGSYGGYAALVGATFTPERFACAVSVVGPSNIVTLLNTIPPYWAPMIDMFTTRVGDHRTEEGRKFLESRSPLNFVDRIRRPLLIGQGANDPRVKQSESDQIVQAMKARNIPVTYVLYPDEGHGFARPENRMSFYAVTEAFLARNLGGRAEPIGRDFEGSSILVPHGAEHVPGLKSAISASGTSADAGTR
jgi:dipeptidyl aminopeptidase/acylaminoacyl peptidase